MRMSGRRSMADPLAPQSLLPAARVADRAVGGSAARRSVRRWLGDAALPAGDLKLEVQWDPHYRAPVWPSTSDGQLMMMHLDIGVADLGAAVAWAMAQGASLAEHQPQPDVRVMLDPEGHPFCLFPDDSL